MNRSSSAGSVGASAYPWNSRAKKVMKKPRARREGKSRTTSKIRSSSTRGVGANANRRAKKSATTNEATAKREGEKREVHRAPTASGLMQNAGAMKEVGMAKLIATKKRDE